MTIHALGLFRLDAERELLLRGSEPTALGRRAIALLRALLARPGAVVSKDALIEAAWPGKVIEESNLTVQIAALRRVLGEAPGGERWIETMPRRGYRFVGPIATSTENGVAAEAEQIHVTPTPHAQAERRQITAMSCELVGNEGRADGIDLEDWREAVGVFRDCVSEIVRCHGGFVISHLGNTVLILFGYPAAHEDDAEAAVRAGLELCASVKALRPGGATMRCRAGIATGVVIVPDTAGVGRDRRHEVIGDTPDLAARLRISGPLDTVTIGPVTRRLLGDLFACREIGAIETTGPS
jgi:DNA-binding winged helix-turn-helix (wHTH) protein